MKRKPNRRKKLIRVLKRKWFKPALYTLGISLLIYMIIGNTVTSIKDPYHNKPHFVISRLSDKFENAEFMHLLLTIQELRILPQTSTQLIKFVNAPYMSPCPKILELELNHMNWTPYAFQSRVKKLFSMYKTYERIAHLNETIDFFEKDLIAGRTDASIINTLNIIKKERDDILTNDMTAEEYDFISEYYGIVMQIIKE